MSTHKSFREEMKKKKILDHKKCLIWSYAQHCFNINMRRRNGNKLMPFFTKKKKKPA